MGQVKTDIPVVINNKVRRFNIAVDNVVLVRIFKRFRRLNSKVAYKSIVFSGAEGRVE